MNKDYYDLTFTDDFMFCRILKDNPDLTKNLVEMILGAKIDRIENLSTQHEIDDNPNSKGIRLDVYFEDDKNTAYDIEMQTYDKGDLAMRTRYYHSLIAVDNLNKGADYTDIKRSCVIFICNFDPFKMCAPLYTARTRFDEFPEKIINDGALTVYLNCKSESDSISPEMRAFFKYISKHLTSEGLTSSIENAILEAKSQKKWRRAFMDLNQIMEKERAEITLRTIPLMMEKGITLEDACEIMNVTIEEYHKIQERLSN